MQTVSRARSRSGNRDEARSRVHGRRQFRPAATGVDSGQPPIVEEGPLWPGPDRPPEPGDSHVQWPYWIVLILPWLMWSLSILLQHLKVCFMCLPDNLPIG
ncbi:MAG TPA: hypothetical protein VKU60_02965 [Chloroflexota bacterium]|nr:hypothetical protein [Chloroflexota bacterium]